MKKIFVLSLTTLLFSSATVFSLSQKNISAPQSYSQIFDHAQKLNEAGFETEASLEYRRYLFFQEISNLSDTKEISAADFLAEYYQKKRDYKNAITFNEHAIETARVFSIKNDTLLFREINLLYNTDNNLFSNDIFTSFLNANSYSPEISAFAWCRLIKSSVLNQDFLLSENYFHTAAALFPQYFDLHSQRSYFSAVNSIQSAKYKNPNLAAGLSVIPGLGQLYAGYPLDALNAFLLNGALMGISAYSLSTGGYIDFALLEFDLVFRFYSGNFYNAYHETLTFNQNKLTSLMEPTFEILDAVETRIKNQYILGHD